ncbi:MAG: glycosyltransferase family 2 protein [Solobacterium sp.]|nr:glycosyltransferase family 2 protein [Solobacterium sp.]
MKKQDEKMILTIFTPAFNRAHTLGRTYESLKKQDCKDFVWLVVDDGSTDNTRELVNKWMEEEKDFEIRYVYKENGGMHSAHNTAYRYIDTLLNTCIDSDDELAEGAARKILEKWQSVQDKGYAGIIALDADMNTGKVIGKGFPEGLGKTTVSGYYDAGGSGDKKLIYRTDIINAYPEYPEFEGEKYVSLSYKYLLIDQDYKMAVLDEVVCNVEYQPDGSSNSMYKQYLRNPRGFAFWRTVRMKYDTTMKRRIMDCIHYCSSAQIGHIKGYVKDSPYPLLTVLCTPIGHVLTAYIRKKAGTV